MGDAKAAARSRAYRKRKAKHAAGDHSLCIDGNCDAVSAVTDDVTVTVTRHASVDPVFGAVGTALWAEMTRSWTPSPMHRVMLVETCRLADRLEQLERHLKGGDWLRFRHRDTNDDEVEVVVYVDRLLQEAREQQNTFRQLAVELAKAAAAVKPESGVKGGGKLASVLALVPTPAG